MTLDGTGHVLEAEWRMGRMAARLSPAAGLVGDAGLAATRLTVAHRGPPPLPTGENRLCLPPRLAPAAVEDDFQRRTADGLLVVGGDAQQPTSLMTRVRDAVALRVRPTTHGSLGTPRSALDTGAGDCTEAADVLARALAAQHLAARVEIGLMHDTTSGRWEGHAWTSAYDPVAARWVHLDPFYPDQSRSLYVKIGSGTSVADAIARSRLLDLLGSEPLEPIRAYRNSPVRSALATASDLECTSSFP
jgi:hypothetical protein